MSSLEMGFILTFREIGCQVAIVWYKIRSYTKVCVMIYSRLELHLGAGHIIHDLSYIVGLGHITNHRFEIGATFRFWPHDSHSIGATFRSGRVTCVQNWSYYSLWACHLRALFHRAAKHKNLLSMKFLP